MTRDDGAGAAETSATDERPDEGAQETPDENPDEKPDDRTTSRGGRHAEPARSRRPPRRGRPFRLARFTAVGYERTAVDEFLAEVEAALQRTPASMAPYEVQDKRFPPVRWSRGYDMRAVDERLEALHAELREVHGDDGVSEVQGHGSERRRRRVALAIYVVAALIVVALAVVALMQL